MTEVRPDTEDVRLVIEGFCPKCRTRLEPCTTCATRYGRNGPYSRSICPICRHDGGGQLHWWIKNNEVHGCCSHHQTAGQLVWVKIPQRSAGARPLPSPSDA